MNLDPNWVVGFVDGEGCFCVSIVEHKQMALKKQVQPEFGVVQHKIDITVLHGLKNYFNCGTVKQNHGDRWMWAVKSRKHLVEIVIPFFEKHHLVTKKRQEFLTFRDIVYKMEKGEHLTQEGLDEIALLSEKLRILTPDQRALKDVAKEKRVAKRAAVKPQKQLSPIPERIASTT